MGAVKTFRDLDAWQVAMDVVELTYRTTADLPDTERFGLCAQMRRAAVSIPSNIAEGQAVRAPRWSLRHVVTAIGSAAELDTQLEAGVRLQFFTLNSARDLQKAIDRTQMLLYGLRREKERQARLPIATTAFLVVGLLVQVLG